MADYFTHFSCLLDVGTPDNAARALEIYTALGDENLAEDPPSDGFALSIEPDHGGTRLWIRDDVTDDPQRVIDFVLLCAKTFGLTGGTYDGTLYVVDLGRSEVVCQGSLTWRIPTKPTFSLNKSSTKAQVGARAETDYRERFFDGATARIKALTNGKLRLGYKPLD